MIYPTQYDLKCYRGQSWNQDIILENMDLTGVTVKAQVRPRENSTTLTQEMTSIINVGLNKVTLSISATDTAKITPGVYAYDVKIISAQEEVQYYIFGKFTVKGRVTI